MKTNLFLPRSLELYFGKKVTKECCDPDETLADTKGCLSDTTSVIPKLIGVQFRKSLGNIKFSKFLPGWTNYKICIGEVENSNFSQQGVVSKARFSPGSFLGWIQLGHWGRVFKFRRWLRIKKAFYVLQNWKTSVTWIFVFLNSQQSSS